MCGGVCRGKMKGAVEGNGSVGGSSNVCKGMEVVYVGCYWFFFV